MTWSAARTRAAIVAALGIGVPAVVLSGWVGVGSWGEPRDVALGRRVYAARCASCHGVNLEGQTNWQEALPDGRMPAPPHDVSGHTWHHSDEELFTVTKSGLAALVPGHDSAMPAFADVLSDDEIRAVLAFIKSTWPRREREYQAARGKAAQ